MNNIFDEYSRKARLFPALLCSLPFLVVKHYLIDSYFGSSLANEFSTLLIEDTSLVLVLTYLLAQANRFISKNLFENKSKFPTTLMLLPSSNALSPEFRIRLEQKVLNDFQLAIPNLTDEQSNPENTKTRLKEIVSLIINKVGNGRLLLQHNVEYGFVRNLIGGSVVSSFVSCVSTVLFAFVFPNKTAEIISIAFLIAYLIPIILSKPILNNFGKEYARILFREYLGS